MATATGEGGFIALLVYGFLLFEDGGRGLKGDADNNILAVGNAPLGTARAIGAGANGAIGVSVELVIVLTAGEKGTGKPGAQLKAIGRASCRERV